MAKPRIGLLLGDPSGIGPELAAKLLSMEDVREAADILVLGRPSILAAGSSVAKLPVAAPETLDPARGPDLAIWDCVSAPGPFPIAEVSAVSGRYVLESLERGAAALENGDLDGLVFAPLNKQAMKKAGLAQEDELRFFAHRLEFRGPVSEINLSAGLWTSRVTSHVPLKDVAGLITPTRIFDAVAILDHALKRSGLESPRIAVAALNPHGGEGGTMGSEELTIIGPAIEEAREQGFSVFGPVPADVVFIQARRGDYDAVVSMYHDQGQIATKLLGFDRGVTLLGGLPQVITTPAHGTAFDITGKGAAQPGAIREAFFTAVRLARTS